MDRLLDGSVKESIDYVLYQRCRMGEGVVVLVGLEK